MKKLTALLLALVLMLSLSTTAFAEEGEAVGDAENFGDNTQETVVSIKTATGTTSSNLSATVPLTVTLAVKANGTIIGPGNYTVTNTSVMPIKITSVVVAAQNGFKITAEQPGTDITAITMKNDEDTTGTALNAWISTVTGTKWNMTAKNTANASVGITFGGEVTSITQDITNAVPAFTITYTIASGAHV